MSSRREPTPPDLSKRNRFDRVRAAETPNRGFGLFATAPVKAGRAVGRILGEIKPPGYRSVYCMGFGEGGLEPAAPYRFVNHSCDPNCELVEWDFAAPDDFEPETPVETNETAKKGESRQDAQIDGVRQDAQASEEERIAREITPSNAAAMELWLHAVRDVAPGEELTIDYGWDWRAAIPCLCGSPKCRGWICKESELETCRRERGAGTRRAVEGNATETKLETPPR